MGGQAEGFEWSELPDGSGHMSDWYGGRGFWFNDS